MHEPPPQTTNPSINQHPQHVIIPEGRKTQTKQNRLANIPSSPTADFVQELYLKELKAYKAPLVKESDAQGQVLAFQQPKAPKSPEEADLASSLKEYESMAVEVEGQQAGADGATAAAVEDWLVEEEDEDEHAHGH